MAKRPGLRHWACVVRRATQRAPKRWASVFALGAGLTAGAASDARADAVADFYRGKQIFFMQSGGEGGGYSSYAQTFAPFLAKHLPGQPRVVVQSMPGAGGIRLMQHFASKAPRDGTYLGMVQSGAAFAPLLGAAKTFEPLSIAWIGAMSRVAAVCAAWHTSGIVTWNDLLTKEYIVGSSGAGSLTETQPALLNKLYGTKIRIVTGYTGAHDIYLAMERGELHGRCGSGVSSIEISRPGWVREGKVKVPIQFALERSKALPDVPTAYELAKDERTRMVMRLVLAPVEMNRPILTTPDVPPARFAALRAAFHAAINDPEFLEHAKRQRLEIEENPGEAVAKIIADAYAMPPDIVATAKEAMSFSGGGKD
jgi:tripartite-type tricarboxylate transporter receptor subunit TctC